MTTSSRRACDNRSRGAGDPERGGQLFRSGVCDNPPPLSFSCALDIFRRSTCRFQNSVSHIQIQTWGTPYIRPYPGAFRGPFGAFRACTRGFLPLCPTRLSPPRLIIARTEGKVKPPRSVHLCPEYTKKCIGSGNLFSLGEDGQKTVNKFTKKVFLYTNQKGAGRPALSTLHGFLEQTNVSCEMEKRQKTKRSAAVWT